MQNKNVLIAEDDNFLCEAYKLKLQKEGFGLKFAQNGEEAIALLKDYTPNVILLDLIMPKVDGFEVLEYLNKNNLLSKIKVIVASNLGQQDDIEKATKMGASDYIIKSNLSMQDLVKKINNL